MFRFIITIIVVVLFFTLSLPMFLVEWIIGLFSKKAQEASSRAIVHAGFSTVKWLSGAKITYIGMENIPTDRPVLYVANHASFFDVILSYCCLPGRVAFISKMEFRKFFFLSVWMYFIKCLFLDRNDIKQGLKTILKAIEQIKDGISMFIFPEGTRSRDGKMKPFKEGSFKIATKTGCPIVPIAFYNTAEIFENHFPKLTPAEVTIEIGKPIYTEEIDKEQLKFIGAKVQEMIQEMLDRAEAKVKF